MRLAMLAVVSAASLIPSIATAGDATRGWHKVVQPIYRDFRRNNCWPHPFVEVDSQAVRTPFATMVQNGWRLQNVMGDHHFDSDTNKLTYAGRAKVRMILQESPPQFRTLFVRRGLNTDLTAIRIDSVQSEVERVLPDGELPAVVQTDLMPPGRSADEVNAINRLRTQTMPPPQLPAVEQGE